MEKQTCILHQNHECIGREKFPINGKAQCCKQEIADEQLIAQSVIDAIDDCMASQQSISKVCSRISYAADMINKCDIHRLEILPELKRFALLVYEFQDRILVETDILTLVCSYMKVVKDWLHEIVLDNVINNRIESMKADLSTLEMALGVCVIEPSFEENLSDIFF